MVRAIIVLVSTFLFACFGALVGYLGISAEFLRLSDGRVTTDSLMIAYAVKPLVGGLLGFAMAVVTLKMFANSKD